MKKNTVCIMITCHNRKNKTIQCIKQVEIGNNDIDSNYVIVDDGSTDGTDVAIKEYLGEKLTYVKGTGNLYYSGGMRLAIDTVRKKHMQADYYLLINDDVEFYANFITKMIEMCHGQIVVGATDDGNNNMTYGGVVSCKKYRPSLKKVMSNNDQIVHCDTFNANCVLIPDYIFDRLDNIDMKYVHGFGDYDFGLEAKKNGEDIVVTHFFVGKCLKNSTAGSWMDASISIMDRIKNKERPNGSPTYIWFYFTRKHFGFFSAVAVVVFQYFRIIFTSLEYLIWSFCKRHVNKKKEY